VSLTFAGGYEAEEKDGDGGYTGNSIGDEPSSWLLLGWE
jgi:hypothetical protein